MNKKNTILPQLLALNLSLDEAKLYVELLKGPSTHLQLARDTGVNRTKVYRLIDNLQKRSLVSSQVNDQGTFLVASDPQTLEVAIVTQEEVVRKQRAIFEQVLPALESLKPQETNDKSFVIQTYEGVEGFKQMLWHELKTKNEILILGSGAIHDLVESHTWAEKHRAMTVKAGYAIREIINPGKKPPQFTKSQEFMNIFTKRTLPEDALYIDHALVIYNNVVATYYWRDDQKVGFEIISAAYARTMRQIFEKYWAEATPE